MGIRGRASGAVMPWVIEVSAWLNESRTDPETSFAIRRA